MKRLGEKLRALREQRGLTIRQVTSALGLSSAGYISKLELGKQKPSLELLMRLADFFEVRPDQLLLDDEEIS